MDDRQVIMEHKLSDDKLLWMKSYHVWQVNLGDKFSWMLVRYHGTQSIMDEKLSKMIIMNDKYRVSK